MANQELKTYMRSKGVLQWQIADELKIHESVLSRKLRYELSPIERQQIRNVVDNISKRQHIDNKIAGRSAKDTSLDEYDVPL